jgi:hypothetical protein
VEKAKEMMKGVRDKVQGKAAEGFMGMIEDMMANIDLFDQVADMVKTILPCKAEVTVKGKKSMEVTAMVKSGVLWVGFKRLKKIELPIEDVEHEGTA